MGHPEEAGRRRVRLLRPRGRTGRLSRASDRPQHCLNCLVQLFEVPDQSEHEFSIATKGRSAHTDLAGTAARSASFHIVDAMLIVAAFALSAVLVVGVLSIRDPPPMFPGFITGRLYIAAFSGPFLLGPIEQIAQWIRGRRQWLSMEWAWSAFGMGYVILEASTHWVFGAPSWMPSWMGMWVVQIPFLGPGPIALACAFPHVLHGAGMPWSGWFGFSTALLWSGIGLLLITMS